jgi:hypothetical protein
VSLAQTTPQPNERELQQIFSALTLQELDEKAALLERIDNKYIVDKTVLSQAFERWAPHFNILEIDKKNSFLYDNCYFDDESFSSYNQHRQGKRNRFKVRTRHYVDNQICFVEIKLKGPRGQTVKRRMAYDPNKAENLDTEALAFIHNAYSEAYGLPFTPKLRPALRIRFQRITLVAIEGQERMTIDNQLQFDSGDKSYQLNPDTAIIETKTPGQHGIANKILASLHQHPVKACSKYCVGLALLGKIERFNRFLPAIRKLKH